MTNALIYSTVHKVSFLLTYRIKSALNATFTQTITAWHPCRLMFSLINRANQQRLWWFLSVSKGRILSFLADLFSQIT